MTCDTAGKVKLMLDSDKDDPVWLHLTHVLYIDQIYMNLIGASLLDKNEISTIFGNGERKMVFFKSKELIGKVSKNFGEFHRIHGYVNRSDAARDSANISKE